MKKHILVTAMILLVCFSVSFVHAYDLPAGAKVDVDGILFSWEAEVNGVLSIPAVVGDIQITKIADYAFRGAGVGSVYIEEGVEEIGEGAFLASTVDYVDFPASIKTVGDYAFQGCEELTSFSIYSDDILFGKECFYGTGYLRIGVPCTLDLLSLHDKIADAKGDAEFAFDVMHTDLIPSMVEKDLFGNSIMVCRACGFKGSVYLDDVILPFEDVSSDAWYYPYVSTAYEFGILNGRSDTIFEPNANMTLAEAAKIAACIHSYNTDIGFDFSKEGGKWYDPYVTYCYENNIIDSHVSFDWEKNATRSEMAYLFSRADDGSY